MEHHGLNSYPIPPPSEGFPFSRALRQRSEIGLSGTAFSRIQGPLGGPHRSLAAAREKGKVLRRGRNGVRVQTMMLHSSYSNMLLN